MFSICSPLVSVAVVGVFTSFRISLVCVFVSIDVGKVRITYTSKEALLP